MKTANGTSRRNVSMPQIGSMSKNARALVLEGIKRLEANQLEGAAECFALAAEFLAEASERLRMRANRGEGVKTL